MSIQNEFKFIGWNQEGTSEKIWGYFLRPGFALGDKYTGWGNSDMFRNCCIFWGRRGKAMQFKGSHVSHDLDLLERSKLKKGYVAITEQKLLEIWPTFITEAEGKLMWEVLSGKVK